MQTKVLELNDTLVRIGLKPFIACAVFLNALKWQHLTALSPSSMAA